MTKVLQNIQITKQSLHHLPFVQAWPSVSHEILVSVFCVSFQVFVINTGFFKAIGTKGYPNIGLLRCGWMRLGANTDGLLFASSLIMFNNITRERPIVALIHTISSLRKSLCVITIRIALYEALHNQYDSKANSHRYTICGHFLHKKEQQCFNNNFAQPCWKLWWWRPSLTSFSNRIGFLLLLPIIVEFLWQQKTLGTH